MAEKDQQKQSYPPPQINPYGRVDEEVVEVAEDLRRKNRKKCIIKLTIFTLFQIGMTLLFVLVFMRVRTPRFRVRSAAFETFESQLTNPSFNIRMIAELGVRNVNFGQFRYRDSTIDFFYGGTKVGEAVVPRSRANARNTRKFNVIVDLRSTNITNTLELGNDLNSGVLPLTSQSRLRGRVTLMMVMRRNRSSNMNCTMGINIVRRELQNVICR